MTPAIDKDTKKREGGRRTGEEDGEDEDEPDAGALDGLDAGDAEDGDLRGRVEAEAEDETEGVHLPRAVDGPEELPEDAGEDTAAAAHLAIREIDSLGAVLVRLIAQGPQPATSLERSPQLADETVQDPSVAETEHDEERRADGGADDVPDVREAVEAIPQRTARGRDGDAGDDDDGAVAEREERADGGRATTGSDETPGGEVDGRDVVCIEGVAQAERVGERGGRGETGMGREDEDGDEHPEGEVDGDEEGDDADGLRGERLEGHGGRVSERERVCV